MDKTVMALLIAFFYCMAVVGAVAVFGAVTLIPAGLAAVAALLFVEVKE
jgi:hypothetical protein